MVNFSRWLCSSFSSFCCIFSFFHILIPILIPIHFHFFTIMFPSSSSFCYFWVRFLYLIFQFFHHFDFQFSTPIFLTLAFIFKQYFSTSNWIFSLPRKKKIYSSLGWTFWDVFKQARNSIILKNKHRKHLV